MTKVSKETGILSQYFPMIRSKEEIIKDLERRPELHETFLYWPDKQQEEFLNFCSGAKGVKVLYDGIFKEVFNAEYTPERLEEMLSLLLGRKIKIKLILPNDSVRLGMEESLIYTDIIAQLEDGSLSNIEIQKMGYAFPGQRSACYSADHLLRQYKRVRGELGKNFTYRSIKNVYTIVFFEKSEKTFHQYPNQWLHKFTQKSNTGLSLELLQEYYFISLDIYKQNMQNKYIEDGLEAWLAFLSFDDPERIVELITRFPKFKAMYQDIYELCLNTERMVGMYSKELMELDRNTIRYMMDEMQAEMDKMQAEMDEKDAEILRLKTQLVYAGIDPEAK